MDQFLEKDIGCRQYLLFCWGFKDQCVGFVDVFEDVLCFGIVGVGGDGFVQLCCVGELSVVDWCKVIGFKLCLLVCEGWGQQVQKFFGGDLKVGFGQD